MIWILTTILILLRCKNSSHRFQQRIGPLAVRIQRGDPFYRTSQFVDSEEFDFLVWFSPAVEDSAAGALSLNRATKFIIGLDFAVTLPSPDSFCVLHDITSEHSAELKWLMSDKHKRWFHSTRVKFPLVSMSARWCLVSMYLIWILGSKLILSNNQSRATLWVPETCLIVGLLPFIIILITASLSSNTTKLPDAKILTFEEIESTLSKSLITLRDCLRLWFVWGPTTGLPVLSWFWVVFPRTETIRSHKSRAGIPFNLNPASQEMISDPVELCETEVCFLHIQPLGTMKQSQPALFCSVTHITILFIFTCVMNIWYQTIQLFVTGFGPFCYGSCELFYWP